jgi:hypothetical protein
MKRDSGDAKSNQQTPLDYLNKQRKFSKKSKGMKSSYIRSEVSTTNGRKAIGSGRFK